MVLAGERKKDEYAKPRTEGLQEPALHMLQQHASHMLHEPASHMLHEYASHINLVVSEVSIILNTSECMEKITSNVAGHYDPFQWVTRLLILSSCIRYCLLLNLQNTMTPCDE